MGWNGADLVNEFSAELSDTSTAFKARVVNWINQGLYDIATSHTWPFLRVRGQSILTANLDTHILGLRQPSAPSIATANGGSLTADTTYSVLVTFYESVADVESIAGVASSSVTPTGSVLSLDVTSVPVSTNPLVTARKIYVSKGGAAYYYHSTIANNTSTTTTISTNTTSTVTPPDSDPIYLLDGELYIEGTQVMQGYALQRLRFETNAQVTNNGTPNNWALVSQNTVAVYPRPSSDTTVTYYYYKIPAPVANMSTSVPQLPAWMYEALHDYVIWRGYQYRDRAGQESKRSNYDIALRTQISRKGLGQKKSGRVRSVTPDSDGYAT